MIDNIAFLIASTSLIYEYDGLTEAAIAEANAASFESKWMRIDRMEQDGVKAMTAHPDGLPPSRRDLISISVPLISSETIVLSFMI